ncbi:MAG: Sec-independent protein translocase TatA [Sphingomonas sp.]|nr:Sec-independent protein translocase TatA [Sphingomonas sp.]|tara:strand:+ start:899 stop:1129 length:231 start_codon:yes stop_codon:yes gene_type:complete
MSPSIWQILIFALIAILLLGGGRFSNMMGDVAKGIKNFKKGMSEEENATPPTKIEARRAPDPGVETETERAREEQR